MEDLALIVSLMLFIPIVVGIAAIVLAILQRKNQKLRTFSIVLTGIVGVTAVLGLVQYVPLGIVPALETFVASLILLLSKRNTGGSLED